jgi:hypothetical protein
MFKEKDIVYLVSDRFYTSANNPYYRNYPNVYGVISLINNNGTIDVNWSNKRGGNYKETDLMSVDELSTMKVNDSVFDENLNEVKIKKIQGIKYKVGRKLYLENELIPFNNNLYDFFNSIEDATKKEFYKLFGKEKIKEK